MDLDTLIMQKISTFRHGYYFWIFVYGMLGLGSIVGPAVAAMKQNGSRIASIVGGLCVAIFGFVQPNTYATAFDIALRIARDVQIAHAAGTIKPDQVQAELTKAEDITHFTYSGLQNSSK